jgi:hypothetical protein
MWKRVEIEIDDDLVQEIIRRYTSPTRARPGISRCGPCSAKATAKRVVRILGDPNQGR